MKKSSLIIASSSFLGGLLTSWVAPKIIGWYFEPPVEIGVNCRPAVDWAMEKLRLAQSVGLLVGLVAGVVLVFLFREKKDQPLKNLPR